MDCVLARTTGNGELSNTQRYVSMKLWLLISLGWKSGTVMVLSINHNILDFEFAKLSVQNIIP